MPRKKYSDRIVFLIKGKLIEEKLLREEILTPSKTKDLCKAFEIAQSDIRSMQGAIDDPTEVNTKIYIILKGNRVITHVVTMTPC